MQQYAKLSEEHQKEWMDFCEKLSKLNLTKDMTTGLNYIFGKLEDSETLNKAYWSVIHKHYLSTNEAVEILRIMAPLMENPNISIKKW